MEISGTEVVDEDDDDHDDHDNKEDDVDEQEVLESDPDLASLPTKKKRKAPSTAFKPGRSGNPMGRPRSGFAMTEVFRDALDERIGEDRKTKLRVIFDVLFKRFLEGETLASRIILERAYGSPVQDLSVTNPDGSLGGPRIVIEVPAKEAEEPEKPESFPKSGECQFFCVNSFRGISKL